MLPGNYASYILSFLDFFYWKAMYETPIKVPIKVQRNIETLCRM